MLFGTIIFLSGFDHILLMNTSLTLLGQLWCFWESKMSPGSIKYSWDGAWISFESALGYGNIRAGAFSEKHDLTVTGPEYKMETRAPRGLLLTFPIDASPLSWTVSGDQHLAAPVAVKPAVWQTIREERWQVETQRKREAHITRVTFRHVQNWKWHFKYGLNVSFSLLKFRFFISDWARRHTQASGEN